MRSKVITSSYYTAEQQCSIYAAYDEVDSEKNMASDQQVYILCKLRQKFQVLE